MAPLTDATRLAAYKDALGNWAFQGYIDFTGVALRWVRRELNNLHFREIGRLMYEYVEAGGEIDEVRETRPEWADHKYHYDLRFTIEGIPVYIETRLLFQPPFVPDEPTIFVVNIHAP